MKQLRNPLMELERIKLSKVSMNTGEFNEHRANRLIKKYKRKTNKFCERSKGFYKCRNCNGVGYLYLKLAYYNRITFIPCNVCGRTGIVFWIDKMVGRG